MRSRLIATLAFLLLQFGFDAQCQTPGAVSIGDVIQITADRAGDFYAVTTKAIYKYDTTGHEIARQMTSSPITLFDIGNGVRLLAFMRDGRKYVIYSPLLEPRDTVTIDPAFAIEPWLVCSSGDYDVIILDAADWSIKKIDSRRSAVDFEFNLDLTSSVTPDIVFMREYQGFLFLLDRNVGITIYNRLGMKLRTLPVAGLRSFNFLGEDLYYYRDGNIHFINLFTLEGRSVGIEGLFHDMVLGNHRFLGLQTGGLVFGTFPTAKTYGNDR